MTTRLEEQIMIDQFFWLCVEAMKWLGDVTVWATT